jgi:flagellar hook protein FlgE
MSLISALNTGTTGLESSSLELSVIGDNIANANTIGFKTGRAAFEDELSQTVVGSSGQIGMGSRLQAVQQIVTQGALSTTGVATDLALQGPGFFIVNGTHDGQAASYYTRAGQFTVDNTGYLVNLDGLNVQGYTADATGVVGGPLGNLLVEPATSAPLATAAINARANLNANDPLKGPFDPLDPTNTSNLATTVSVYDSLGAVHQVQVFFTRTAGGAWDWNAMEDGAGLTGGTAGTMTSVASGTMTFDTQGRLTAMTQASTFNPIGAVNPQPLTFDFGDPTGGAPAGTGLAGITQFASASANTFIGQDGYGSGSLSSVQVDTRGNVSGVFSNGQTRILGQVAVASFTADDQLARVGGNLYQSTPSSGQPSVGTAGTGGRANIASGSLEQSNVDLAGQFVRMIAAQRAFEANSKTITTADQLLQELINLKR